MGALEDRIKRRIYEKLGLDPSSSTPQIDQYVAEIGEQYEAAKRRTAGQLETPRESQIPSMLEANGKRIEQERGAYEGMTKPILDRGAGYNALEREALQNQTDAKTRLMQAGSAAVVDQVGGTWMDVAGQTQAARQKLLDATIADRQQGRSLLADQLNQNRGVYQRGQTLDFLKDLAVTGYMLFGD